jgi:hypothetical protein
MARITLGGQKAAQVFFRQVQQQGFVQCQAGNRDAFGAGLPFVAMGFATVVAVQRVLLSQHHQLALNGAQIAINSHGLEPLMNLGGGDFSGLRNHVQHGQSHAERFVVVGAFGAGHRVIVRRL